MEKKEEEKSEINIPKEIILPKEIKEEPKEDKIDIPQETKDEPIYHQEGLKSSGDFIPKEFKQLKEYNSSPLDEEIKDKIKQKRINRIILVVFGITFLIILGLLAYNYTLNTKNQEFGTDVVLNNNPTIPVDIKNTYNHTIINNIVINIDNETMSQIANNLAEEIRTQLNLTNSS